MSTVRVGSVFQAGRFRLAAMLLSLGLVVLAPLPSEAQPGPLSFFKNYFITGDYVVGGVGLRGRGVNGLATDTITIEGVPADADVVAAFLYWQVVATTSAGPDSGSLNVSFKGHPLRSAEGPFAKLLTVEGTAPCWSSGGSTGSSGGSKATYTYRADVLRYFEVDGDTRKLSVNGPHLVSVPDSGSGGNSPPLALGASLVVIYRQSTLPLSAIVLYDGGYTLDNSTGQMFQTLGGFYQPVNAAVAKLTHIVGSGQMNKTETLLFGAGTGTPLTAVATNPFRASAGDSWDNYTFTASLGGAAESVTQVTTGVSPSSDCLTWGAVVFKTEVKDTDSDGLLDVWESSTTPLIDPNGQALPNLQAMGADPTTKDIFVEVGYMKTGAAATYGGVSKPAHSHLPGHAALKLVGEAFAKEAIRVHFDVGNSYPPGEADQYIIRGAGLARGGEAIDESITQCLRGATDQPWVCQFSDYPGTVGWKSGFRFLRDQVFSVSPEPPATSPPTPLEDYCDVPGYTCDRRFDRNRKDMFRYALFAHAIGLPKSEEPCLDAAGAAVPPAVTTGRCDAPLRDNPDFHAPRTNTGVGDFPGADLLVTLGGFADHDGLPVGTPFMQASTLMHELGHNLERRHGGEAFEPNCKPTYLSVMNYLYQLRGLLDDYGTPHLDFSGSSYGSFPIDETSLTDGTLGGLPYRIGWYAPLSGSYLFGRGTAALRHCDGSDLLSTDVPMVRIDARTRAGAIDWNANGQSDSAFSLDVNFNGRSDGGAAPLVGSNDWDNILLNQIGGRRNTGGLLVVDSAGHLLVGPMSLDTGRGDLGRGDLGRGDLGRGDLGRGDLGRGDLGRGDLGRGDLGRGDLGRGDLGRGDLGRGDLGGGDLFVGNPYKEGELDAETAGDLARTPPNTFTACVIGVDCPDSSSPLHAVKLGWTAPNVGGVTRYEVYRVAGEELVPDSALTPWTPVGQVNASAGQVSYSLVDSAQLANGARYTYFALAIYGDGVQSDPSNIVTIVAVNDPPAAAGDSYAVAEDTLLTIASPGVLVNDGDPDSSTSALEAVLVSGPSSGTLTLNADGSFVYMPAANFSGQVSFTYKARASYGAGDPAVNSDIATVTISVTPVNDAPVAANDAFATAEDTALTVAAPGVLGNDADVDGPTLTAILVAGPSRGALQLNMNGSFTYTPAPNYNGPDAFTYSVFDGLLYSGPATVSIAVSSVNDAPVASNDTYSVLQGAVLTVAAPGVLGNDTDVDSPLTAAVVSGPSNGTLSLAANGSFAYTPAGTFYGTDSFTYGASDGVASSSATVTITVNRLVYGFVNVQNLPPPSTKTFNLGSAVPLAWRFTVNGVAYNSVNARPRITIRRADNSVVYTGTPTDPGASSFQPPTASNGYTWQFNWQTKGLVATTYYVYITSEQTGQTFPNTLNPPSGGYPVKLK